MTYLQRLFATLIAVAFAACGGMPIQQPEPDAATSGDSEVRVAADGGLAYDGGVVTGDAAPGASDAGAADAAAHTTGVGEVALVQGGSGGGAYAVFQATGAETDGCTHTPIGACTLSVCDASHIAWDPHGHYPNAGVITIDGGSTGGAIVLEPVLAGMYNNLVSTGDSSLWHATDTLRFQAPGMAGFAPGFDERLPAPVHIAITAPMLSRSTLTVSRTAALDLQWMATAPTQASHVLVSLSSFDTSGGPSSTSTTLDCVFASSAGRGQIPATTMAHLPPGDGGINIFSTSQSTVTTDGWTVTLSLREPASIASGPASSPLHLN